MRFAVRSSLLATLAGSLLALWAPSAQASFGVEKFFASNCKASTCEPGEEEEAYQQAAGHPPFGITDFTVKTEGAFPKAAPEGGPITHIRTDVGVGTSTNPEAVKKCPLEEFGTKEVVPGSGAFPESKCSPETKIGENKVVVYVGAIKEDRPLEGTMYNLEQPPGLASDFGIAISLAPLGKPGFFAHTLIEGGVEWGAQPQGTGKGDYHDYYEVKVSPVLPLIKSRLIFEGTKGDTGKGGFITNPTSCVGAGPATTTTLHVTSEGGTVAEKTYTALAVEGCNGLAPFLKVPFEPAFKLEPETTQSDEGDGLTTTLTLPHDPSPESSHPDSSQLKVASVTLPEGMTMNESAAHGLEACTPAKARIHSPVVGVECPEGSKIGTVTINVPGLPPESLKGNIYLGGPESGPITGPPFTIYLDAESARYGISVRLKGEAIPNEATGRLTTIFKENPEQPFTSAILHFNGGALAPVANPLLCGAAATEASFVPYTGSPASISPLVNPFTVDSNGKGGACSSPPPFTPAQSTQNQTANAGASTSFTVAFARGGAQQYLAQTRTVLPEGLVGRVPAVTLCEEPQARLGTCGSSSQIGVANVEAGAGPTPFPFSGPVFLTGPYKGAPYGLSIPVPAVAGPFNLGTVVTRATISVDPYTSRVIATSTLPRLVKGVLVRMRRISVTTNRQGFLLNPTNCSALATESTLSGFTLAAGAITGTRSLSSPFQAAECTKLPFKPSFKAASGARTSKANGASLETTINQGTGQANVRSVKVQLPLQLPSRLTTLQQACLAATFEANPFSCPAGSFVGGVRANTPVLPAKMKGPAILVSHGGGAFPDLDLVLEGNGVRVIVVGNTDIKKGITTTTFASNPDVPVSSVTVNLPVGPHSALAANGDLCRRPLTMPTTIVGQNGATMKQNTRIAVRGCGVRILGRKVIRNTVFLTIQTFAAGRISGGGPGLAKVFRRVRGASGGVSLKIPLSRSGRRHRRPFRTRVRVGFVPSHRGESASVAYVFVTFR